MTSHAPRQRSAWHAAILGASIAISLVFAIGYAALVWADMREDMNYYGMTVIFGGLAASIAALVAGPLAGLALLRTRRKFWQDLGIVAAMLTVTGIIPLYVFFLLSPFISRS